MRFLIFPNIQTSLNIQNNRSTFANGERMNRHETTCCRIDAIVSIDSKGQVVLPKDIRQRMELKPNDKLALIDYERNGETCCIIIIKAKELEKTVNQTLEPMLKDIIK